MDSSMGEMKIRSIAPWFGGKRTMAPEVLIINGPSYGGAAS
jgi:hypothetical protein